MKPLQFLALGSLLLVAGRAAAADTKVELKGTHLCCPQCVKAVGETLKKMDGVTGTCNQKAGSVTIIAKDTASAQNALNALAEAGFHGTTDIADLAMKNDSGVPKGKVKSLTLTNVHNCCSACNRQIAAAVSKVAGVTGHTAKAKSDTFEVTGDFDAEELVKSLNKAGYHVKVKK